MDGSLLLKKPCPEFSNLGGHSTLHQGGFDGFVRVELKAGFGLERGFAFFVALGRDGGAALWLIAPRG